MNSFKAPVGSGKTGDASTAGSERSERLRSAASVRRPRGWGFGSVTVPAPTYKRACGAFEVYYLSSNELELNSSVIINKIRHVLCDRYRGSIQRETDFTGDIVDVR